MANTRLSVNINKIATLRNSRGGSEPNVLRAAIRAQQYGADGITVHPRPDERHIRYSDVREISSIITTEFNIEGNPKEKKFVDLVLQIKPHQVTLVPDGGSQLTSDHGWNTLNEKSFLTEVISEFKKHGIRTSIFCDPDLKMIEGAKQCNTDCIELYTESFAANYSLNNLLSVKPFTESAIYANKLGLKINAGHDLSLENLHFFIKNVPFVEEVSIGHALISDAIYFGLENTIQMYKQKIKSA
jgi:pyridoxine 5-phosphate synthase